MGLGASRCMDNVERLLRLHVPAASCPSGCSGILRERSGSRNQTRAVVLDHLYEPLSIASQAVFGLQVQFWSGQNYPGPPSACD